MTERINIPISSAVELVRRHGGPVSHAALNPSLSIVFSSPAAPLYTNELMVATALQVLREEGIRSVCLGVGPLGRLGRIDGCNGVTKFMSRSLYRLAAKMMNLHGRSEYWDKFHVIRREPLYPLFQSPRIGLRELIALFLALHISVT